MSIDNEITLSEGEYLMREDDSSANMYYVKSGLMAAYKVQGTVEKQIGTIYPNELVGEMSCLDGEPRSASVKAIKESVVIVIPSDKFYKYLDTLPPWFRGVVKTLLSRLRKANQRVRI